MIALTAFVGTVVMPSRGRVDRGRVPHHCGPGGLCPPLKTGLWPHNQGGEDFFFPSHFSLFEFIRL